MKLVETVNSIIEDYTAQGYTLTLRQTYYVLVSRGLIENTVKSYKAIGDLISDAHMAGAIDWDAINDRLREVRNVSTWRHPSDILTACARQFQLDLWKDHTARVEVWVEKDALAEVITKAAHELRCPVMVCRGYMSMSAMWEAGHNRFRQYCARLIEPVVIHLGDHDPSGMDMSRGIEDRLQMFAGSNGHPRHITVRRIALNMGQVLKYEPPPNPAKVTDSRAKDYIRKFGTESWELDALDPRVLHELIQNEIRREICPVTWERNVAQEEAYKARIQEIADNFEE
jgi:hypothetical protein